MKHKRILSVAVVAVLTVALASGVGLTAAYARAQDTPSGSDSQDSSNTSSDSSTSTGDNTESTSRIEALNTEKAREQAKQQAEAAAEQAKQAAEAAREKVAEAKEELKGDRIKVCEARRSAIQTIMKNAAARGQDHINLFSSIAEKVEAFYVSKGKTLATYDQLVADVNAKKAAAQSAVDAVKNAQTQFDCNGTNPKGTIDVFKADIKAQETAMEAFRTSVHNLIAGVKSVQGTTSSSTNGGAQ